jgi:two-component SAPR family response regulator
LKIPADLKVLVAEDEVLIGMLIQDMLGEIGCNAATITHSVEEALGFLETAEPDFAFLDINLRVLS